MRDRWRARRARRAAVVLACGAVAVAGCAGAPSSTAGTSASAPASRTTTAPPSTTTAGQDATAPDPNAPEANAAGDIPDNQVFVPFSPPQGGFVVSVPEGWARSADGAATLFSDKFNSVRVEAMPRPRASDVATSRAEDVPQLQASSGFALGDVTAVTRTAGPGTLITYEVDSAPNPVTGRSVRQSVERYAFWNAGRQVVLTLSGPKGADEVDPWRTVTDSLKWQP